MCNEMIKIKWIFMFFIVVWMFFARRAWKRTHRKHKSTLRTRQNIVYPEDAIYVLTLQGVRGADIPNKHRLDDFISHLESLGCLDMYSINICPGVVNYDLPTGYATTQAWANCLERIYADGVKRAYIFEDDARLLDRNSCVNMKTLLTNRPEDTFLLMYGGHHWTFDTTHSKGIYRAVTQSWGSYGWGIHRENVPILKDGYVNDLHSGKSFLSPDEIWHAIAREHHKIIYAISPLFVKHPKSWSNTWHRVRSKVDDLK